MKWERGLAVVHVMHLARVFGNRRGFTTLSIYFVLSRLLEYLYSQLVNRTPHCSNRHDVARRTRQSLARCFESAVCLKLPLEKSAWLLPILCRFGELQYVSIPAIEPLALLCLRSTYSYTWPSSVLCHALSLSVPFCASLDADNTQFNAPSRPVLMLPE